MLKYLVMLAISLGMQMVSVATAAEEVLSFGITPQQSPTELTKRWKIGRASCRERV